MKLAFSVEVVRRRPVAFTLPEIMVAMTIFALVVSGTLVGFITGLKYFQITRPKLTASEDARKTLDYLVNDVRTANKVLVGTIDIPSSKFTPVTNGQLQLSTALEIWPNTNAVAVIHYYWDSSTGELKRMNNFDTAQTLLNWVRNKGPTNAIIDNATFSFTKEDFQGNILRADADRYIIGVQMQFTQLESGVDNLYDYYQLNTKISRRIF